MKASIFVSPFEAEKGADERVSARSIHQTLDPFGWDADIRMAKVTPEAGEYRSNRSTGMKWRLRADAYIKERLHGLFSPDAILGLRGCKISYPDRYHCLGGLRRRQRSRSSFGSGESYSQFDGDFVVCERSWVM